MEPGQTSSFEQRPGLQPYWLFPSPLVVCLAVASCDAPTKEKGRKALNDKLYGGSFIEPSPVDVSFPAPVTSVFLPAQLCDFPQMYTVMPEY